MAASHGFFNPVCAVTLVTPQGRLPFFDNFTATQEKQAGGVHHMMYVESVEVDQNLGLLPKIQVTLSPPFEEAVHMLNSPLLELGENYLEVQLGYLSRDNGKAQLSGVFRGKMELPDVQLGPEPSIALIAMGDVANMARTEMRGVFTKKSRKEIIEAVCRGANPQSPRGIRVDYTSVEAARDSASFRLLNQQVSLVQGGLSDLEFVRKLAYECSCRILYDLRTGEGIYAIHLLPLSGRVERKPRFILRLYHLNGGQLGEGEYPVLSATSPTKALYTTGALQILLRGIDPVTRKMTEKVVSDQTNPSPRTSETKAGDVSPKAPAAAGKPTPGKPKGTPMLVGGVTPKDVQKAENVVSGRNDEIAINLEVETYGIPDVQPGDMVAFRGMGPRYDRNYEVESVRHSFSGGEFKTSLKLIGNTFEMLASKQQVAAKGPANKQKPVVPLWDSIEASSAAALNSGGQTKKPKTQ